MGYDIPDVLKYQEKFIFGLTARQLIYILGSIVIAFSLFKFLNSTSIFALIPSFLILACGLAVSFLKFDEIILDMYSYHSGIKKARYDTKTAQKFFEVKQIKPIRENESETIEDNNKESAVFLDNGKILMILEVQPVNFEFFDEEKKQTILENFRAYINQLETPIQILVRTQPLELSNYFEELEKRRELNPFLTKIYSDFRIFQQDFYDKQSVYERKFYILMASTNLQNLKEAVSIAIERLKKCNLVVDQLKKQQLIEFYQDYAAVQDTEIQNVPLKDKTEDVFRKTITPTFDIRKDYAKVNGEFHRIIKIVGYPREIRDGWLQPFLTQKANYDVSLHISPWQTESTIVYLQQQLKHQSTDLSYSKSRGESNPALEHKYNDTLNVFKAVNQGQEKLFGVSIYLEAKTPQKNQLSLLVVNAQSHLKQLGMIPKLAIWRMADGLKSMLPVLNDKLKARRDFLTSNVVATFPFISTVTTKKEGIFLGHDIDSFNPVFADYNSYRNKHTFIIGPSGSGKSYTAKYLTTQWLLRESIRIYIVDPNAEYTDLTEKIGGQIIKLAKDSKSIINIFDLMGESYGDKILSLIPFFSILCDTLSKPQEDVLIDVLEEVYQKKGITDDPKTWYNEPPTFSDMLVVLKDRKEHNRNRSQDTTFDTLISRVKRYCKGKSYGFFDRQTKIDVEKGLICFDLKELPEAAKELMMFAVLQFVRKEIRKDIEPKLVIMDEAWSLLRNKQSAEYIFDFVKNTRRFGAGIMFLTQEVDDLKDNPAGEAVLNNCAVKILMGQEVANLNKLAPLLNLTENAKKFLASAQIGQGLFITTNNIQKFQVKASDLMNKLITTRPEDLRKEITPKKSINFEPEKKYNIDLDSGLFERNDLKDEEKEYLQKNGYVLHKSRIDQRGGSSWYLIKKRGKESPEHAFLCYIIAKKLKETFPNSNIDMKVSRGADVIINIPTIGNIAFEIETGSNLQSKDEDQLKHRFNELKAEYEQAYIVVSNWKEKAHYEQYGNVITRNRINDLIEHLKNGYPFEFNEDSA